MRNNLSGILHLDEEAAAVGLDAVAGADPREEAVHRPHTGIARWHVTAQLRHYHRQGYLSRGEKCL